MGREEGDLLFRGGGGTDALVGKRGVGVDAEHVCRWLGGAVGDVDGHRLGESASDGCSLDTADGLDHTEENLSVLVRIFR